MSGRFPQLRNASALLALLLPLGVSAAPVSAIMQARGQAAILKSLSVIKRADLDFGEIVVAGAGTVAIDAVNSTLTINGSLAPVGTGAHRALFTATGSKNSIVLIRLPKNPVTLTRVGGTETMTVSNWLLDGASNRKIPPGNAFNFAVGGTLNVGAGQADGNYVGTFAVTVQYP